MRKEIIARADEAMWEWDKAYQETLAANSEKVLDAFRAQGISEAHMQAGSGYGYDELGRDGLEALFARIFHAEDALLRQQIVSGTHAISLALLGNLHAGERLVYYGQPYDTMNKVIGLPEAKPNSLIGQGVRYSVIDIDFAAPDAEAAAAQLPPDTAMVAIQRSRGYSWRHSLSVAQIGALTAAVKKHDPRIVVFVDDCYGEFVEKEEPLELGADLVAGSLIKNPGGALAPGGGYVAGRAELVAAAAERLTVPGMGKELGASLLSNRIFYQGLYQAPLIVSEALAGAVFAAALMRELGFSVLPGPEEPRPDIVQLIGLETPERLLAFCQGIQRYSPVDSFVRPEPWAMPGYDSQVVMAAGAFVQGSSMELSADAPLREPFCVYLQGGINRYQIRRALLGTVEDMEKAGLL